VKAKPAQPRLLADENTSHRFVSACRQLADEFPIVHVATWQDGPWLGLDDSALLPACPDAGLVLVGFDRATLPWHAGQVIRGGGDHGGLILFRRSVRSTDYSDAVDRVGAISSWSMRPARTASPRARAQA
jgi:hypothetical protein